jgi:hypothetical protein
MILCGDKSAILALLVHYFLRGWRDLKFAKRQPSLESIGSPFCHGGDEVLSNAVQYLSLS